MSTKEIKELQTLLEISEVIHSAMDLKVVFKKLIGVLTSKMGVNRCALTLLKANSDELLIEVAHGHSDQEIKRGKYKVGEGITGRVVQSGKPMIIPKISKEPMFLNKTKSRKDLKKKDISFICVPIKIGKDTVGAFSTDKLYKKEVTLEEDLRLLTIISSMIAHTVKINRDVAKEKNELKAEADKLRHQLSEKYNITNIVGNSNVMHVVYTQIIQAAKGNAAVLIRGESGTGKELVAHAIHYNSLRTEKPFVKVNCAAIPIDLIESELFGHEKGAFTDAYQKKIGKFEMAHGGTIFLDEIGDLSPSTQVKLLRVLQEKEFERVGGTETVKANFRLISATNRNLEEMIKETSFREDLFYRLNVFTIYLPALRERKTDILLLAEHFLRKYCEENSKEITRISTPAIDMMMSYHWPGNVRELENCIERAVLVCESDSLHGYDLPPTLQIATGEKIDHDQSFEERVAAFEKDLLVDALKAAKGNVSKAAEHLKTTVRILGYKMKSYGIDYKIFR